MHGKYNKCIHNLIHTTRREDTTYKIHNIKMNLRDKSVRMTGRFIKLMTS